MIDYDKAITTVLSLILVISLVIFIAIIYKTDVISDKLDAVVSKLEQVRSTPVLGYNSDSETIKAIRVSNGGFLMVAPVQLLPEKPMPGQLTPEKP